MVLVANKMKKEVYVDYAAATPLRKEVLDAMTPYLTTEYGNPGSLNGFGRRARDALNEARRVVAHCLNAKPTEVIFTGSGTESINLAIKGVARAYKDKGNHIITSTIEHHAVLHTCAYLQKHEGCKITYLKSDKQGMIDPEDLRKAITKETILISISYANNEVGSINNIAELTKIAHAQKILFHTDACQAATYLSLDTQALGVDLMTINGSKIYGPKGTGCLYKKQHTQLHPLLHGGGQESNFRSGTENLPGIVGFATALSLCQKERGQEGKRLLHLREKLTKGILNSISQTSLNGHPTHRLPNHVNITFKNVEGEVLLLALDDHGIAASSGSACASQSKEPSHVLQALGKSKNEARSSIRFTLGHNTTEQDVDYILTTLPDVIKKVKNNN